MHILLIINDTITNRCNCILHKISHILIAEYYFHLIALIIVVIFIQDEKICQKMTIWMRSHYSRSSKNHNQTLISNIRTKHSSKTDNQSFHLNMHTHSSTYTHFAHLRIEKKNKVWNKRNECIALNLKDYNARIHIKIVCTPNNSTNFN